MLDLDSRSLTRIIIVNPLSYWKWRNLHAHRHILSMKPEYGGGFIQRRNSPAIGKLHVFSSVPIYPQASCWSLQVPRCFESLREVMQIKSGGATTRTVENGCLQVGSTGWVVPVHDSVQCTQTSWPVRGFQNNHRRRFNWYVCWRYSMKQDRRSHFTIDRSAVAERVGVRELIGEIIGVKGNSSRTETRWSYRGEAANSKLSQYKFTPPDTASMMILKSISLPSECCRVRRLKSYWYSVWRPASCCWDSPPDKWKGSREGVGRVAVIGFSKLHPPHLSLLGWNIVSMPFHSISIEDSQLYQGSTAYSEEKVRSPIPKVCSLNGITYAALCATIQAINWGGFTHFKHHARPPASELIFIFISIWRGRRRPELYWLRMFVWRLFLSYGISG